MSAPVSNPQPDVDLIKKWLDLLYGNHEPGQWLSLFAVDRQKDRDDRFRSVEWGQTGAHLDLARTIALKAQTCDVWLGAATRTTNLGGSRGGDRDTCQLPGVWCDIDIAGPGHSDDRYPRDLTAALALVATFPLPPTAIIHTGGGIQPWWLFDEPVDADEASPLLARWAHRWQDQARIADVTIDSVWDLSRVLRVPGTLNRKLDLPRPVLPLEGGTHTARYTVEDLLELCPDPPAATITPLHRAGQPYHGPERPGDHFNRMHTCADVLGSTGQFTPAGRPRNGEQHYHYQGAANQTSLVVYDDGHAAIYSATAARQLHGAHTRHAYDPYGLYSLLHHAGDHSAAASALRSLGYGARNNPGVDWITSQTGTDVHLEPPGPNPEPWPTPQPVNPTADPPEWPVHALPPWIAAHCNTVADRVQVPAGLTCQQALACLATVVMGRLKARITDTWTETLNLYLVTSMDSGGGKSPADKHITGALVDLEQQLVDNAQESLSIGRIRRQKAEGDHEATLKAYKAGKASEGEMLDAQKGLEQNPEPVEPRLLADDATPEALTGIMAEHDGRMAIISTEAALFDIVCGAYADRGRGVNLDVYLKGWSGERIDVQRKGTGRVHIKAALLTVGLTVQPHALNQLRGTQVLSGRGFIPRFMFAIPASLTGWRDTKKVMDATPMTTATEWAAGLRRMWTDANRHNGQEVTFSRPALDLIGTWQAALEVRQREGGDLHDVSPWCSKMKGSVIRTAALLHLADGGVGTQVPAATFSRAVEIGDYWIAHALRVEAIATGGLVAEADRILKWIGALDEPWFTGRDLLRSRSQTVDDVYDALELLVEKGWIRVRDGYRLADFGRRGAPSPIFDAHPNLVGERMKSQNVGRSVGRVGRAALVRVSNPPPLLQPLPAKNPLSTRTPRGTADAADATPHQDASQPPPTQPDASGSILFGPDPDEQGDQA